MSEKESNGGEPGSHSQNTAREIWANGMRIKSSEVEAKLDTGNIEEAESLLKEGLSVNHEEAMALLGGVEYLRGNVEAALSVFDGIDLQAAIERLRPSLLEIFDKKNRPQGESSDSPLQNAASLMLEAIYLKSLSLKKLGKATEAVQECRIILDAVEKIFQNGIPDVMVDRKLQETISMAVELLPELCKQAGQYQEAMSSYRRVLLNQWDLNDDCCTRIQKQFSVFLLFGGVEIGPPSLAVQVDGSFVPKNNLEEAILLLMVVLRKCHLGKAEWDPSVMENLTFALSICGQSSMLARQIEELLPGVYPRYFRWSTLAVCYSGAGNNKASLNLLRKSLNRNENPNDLLALLLASKICSEDCFLAGEGVEYARRAISNAQGMYEHLKGVGLRFLGICLGKQAKIASSDQERSRLQTEALKSLDEAIALESPNPDLIFDLGIEYAEHRNMNAALRYAKKFIDATGGSVLKGWKLLALILSAQHRYLESEVVTDAALDETAKWEQGSLLRIKAKLKAAQFLPMDSVETYRFLLALIQAQRKAFGSFRTDSQIEDDKASEFEVWHGLANLYSSLSHWKDTELCLEKAKMLKPYSGTVLHTEGAMYEARGQIQEALVTYCNALLLDSDQVSCKVSVGALMSRRGSKSSSIAWGFLSDALRLEPTNRNAWYYLGMVHRDDGRLSDAAECFQAASMLDESEPIENFSSL